MLPCGYTVIALLCVYADVITSSELIRRWSSLRWCWVDLCCHRCLVIDLFTWLLVLSFTHAIWECWEDHGGILMVSYFHDKMYTKTVLQLRKKNMAYYYYQVWVLKRTYYALCGVPFPVVLHVNGLQRLKSLCSLQREFLSKVSSVSALLLLVIFSFATPMSKLYRRWLSGFQSRRSVTFSQNLEHSPWFLDGENAKQTCTVWMLVLLGPLSRLFTVRACSRWRTVCSLCSMGKQR